MSSKVQPKQRKDSQPEAKRTVQQLQRIRVIQDNLVFINGLPSQLADPQLLKSQSYFGRYGKVLKVVINTPPAFRKNSVAQAYVTYGSEIQASMAIVALDGFNFQDRPLKVSYGTTKYCTHFLRGYQCLNSECFYLHKADKTKEVLSGDPRNNFQQQNDRAFDVVNQHLEEVIKRLIEEGQQTPEEGFPSLMEMVDFLVESKFLSKSEVDTFLDKHKLDLPLKLQTSISTPPLGDKWPENDSPKQMKLTKSNSFSTMASPTKSQTEQKSAQKSTKPQISQKVAKLQKKIPSNQQLTSTRKEALQQKIEKMIIKKVFVAGAPKSRLSFANVGSKQSPQELIKLKGIVQKYLIAIN